MLKFHPITAFIKTYTNIKKIFLARVSWLKYIFRIKFKIPILDLMLLPKTVFHLKGYTTVVKVGIFFLIYTTWSVLTYMLNYGYIDDR